MGTLETFANVKDRSIFIEPVPVVTQQQDRGLKRACKVGSAGAAAAWSCTGPWHPVKLPSTDVFEHKSTTILGPRTQRLAQWHNTDRHRAAACAGRYIRLNMLLHAVAGHTSAVVFMQAYWRNVKERPCFMLLPPVLVFCVLCSLSVMGVVKGADKFEADTRSRAESAALDWVRKLCVPCVYLSVCSCCSLRTKSTARVSRAGNNGNGGHSIRCAIQARSHRR